MPHLLNGEWDFRFDNERDWRTITVPGCWDALDGIAKNISASAWYRKRIDIPREFSGKRIWLRFDGVSYHCEVQVNGRDVWSHTGIWDSFSLEITDTVRAGQQAELLVKVEKPASLTAGPDSKPVRSQFPLKETLSGFLPYVWGHMFGGIWQDVALYATGRNAIEQFSVRGDARGHCVSTIATTGRGRIEISEPDGRVVHNSAVAGGKFEFDITKPRAWSPADPALYSARLTIDDGDERTIRFGLRSLSVAGDGTTLLLNDAPIYPRMILSWGWYPDSLHSNPGPERVRAEMLKLKSLGYNGIKLCLWFPPQYYFDLADELGMLLWVELPMWLPDPTSHFRKQTPIEYDRLARLASQHPSVILYTLGCELNKSIGPNILEPLFKIVKSHAGDALVRDNSGGGDAYGGLLNEFAEFYDYHFYSDLQFFRPLLDAYAPRGRPNQPWVFGEFCDLDTFRDLRHLKIANGDRMPWWTVRDDKLNPQGARWQFDIVDWESRLKENGYWDRGEELVKLSNRYALLHRKHTLETVRLYREIGGYVVTGQRDTPISTAGMWDDLGELKFDADEFRAFNDDTVLLLGWDRHRAWINGGDRVAQADNWCHVARSTVRPHLIISHFGDTAEISRVEWSIDDIARGAFTKPIKIQPGELRELCVAEFVAPDVDRPRRATFRAVATIGGKTYSNSWNLWFFPKDPLKKLSRVALLDPVDRLHGLPFDQDAPGRNAIIIGTSWTDELDRAVSQGGRAILLQSEKVKTSPVPIVEMPFWRESIRLIESKHAAWQDFPIDDGLAEMQFFGLATDCALDTSKIDRKHRPILRRLDARTARIHDYATEIEWGNGRLIVSTLRFEGSSGLANSSQPLGISRNIAALHLLKCWVEYLQQPNN